MDGASWEDVPQDIRSNKLMPRRKRTFIVLPFQPITFLLYNFKHIRSGLVSVEVSCK
jgi:hypothetical protein